MSDRPSIIVHSFKTTYEKNHQTGRRDRPVDWVTYSPTHSALYTQVTDRVDWMRPDSTKIKNDDEGKKLDFLRWRWEMIERAYKAWKDGHEIPVDGTPLAAWPGINTAQADVFRSMGIRSVEQIATMTDSVMGRVQLPGVRDLQQQAKAFLEAHDRNSTANRLNELEAVNAALQERLEAAMALIDEQTRPTKAKKAEAAQEAA